MLDHDLMVVFQGRAHNRKMNHLNCDAESDLGSMLLMKDGWSACGSHLLSWLLWINGEVVNKRLMRKRPELLTCVSYPLFYPNRLSFPFSLFMSWPSLLFSSEAFTSLLETRQTTLSSSFIAALTREGRRAIHVQSNFMSSPIKLPIFWSFIWWLWKDALMHCCRLPSKSRFSRLIVNIVVLPRSFQRITDMAHKVFYDFIETQGQTLSRVRMDFHCWLIQFWDDKDSSIIPQGRRQYCRGALLS